MARAGDLEVNVDTASDGKATVVRVDGELDMATCPELAEVLEGVDSRGRTVIDLTGCTFLDSSAVRVLVASARTAGPAGGAVALVTRDPGILRVLEIASVDSLLPVYDTVELASVTQEN